MPKNYFRYLLYLSLIFAALAVPGCEKAQQPRDRAEKVVEEFLGAWSRSEPSNTFADPNHPIQGTDPDWKAGCRLLSFLCAEIKQSEETPNRVRCRAALSLQDKKGRKWEKEVVYDVQVGEKSVISRVKP